MLSVWYSHSDERQRRSKAPPRLCHITFSRERKGGERRRVHNTQKTRYILSEVETGAAMTHTDNTRIVFIRSSKSKGDPANFLQQNLCVLCIYKNPEAPRAVTRCCYTPYIGRHTARPSARYQTIKPDMCVSSTMHGSTQQQYKHCH